MTTWDEFRSAICNCNSPILFFDIETRGADERILKEIFSSEEVDLPKHPGEFDPSRVKYGNIKDEQKRREKLSQVMESHAQDVSNWESDCLKAKEEAWEKFVDRAALSPLTGRVVAIGYGLKVPGSDVTTIFLDVELARESELLERFWYIITLTGNKNGRAVSFNGHGFDFPFCRRRAWVHDIPTPELVTKYNKYEDWCFDLLEFYKRGGKWGDSISLDNLALMLGTRRKMQGMKGNEFQKAIIDDPEKALNYLAGDVLCLIEATKKINP